MAPASLYFYDPTNKRVSLDSRGTTQQSGFPSEAAGGGGPDAGGRPTATCRIPAITITLKLGARRATRALCDSIYPFVPFQGWDTQSDIVLEKVVDGAVVARASGRASSTTRK